MKKIEPQLVEKILNYLATRPWGEVNDIIVPLTQLEDIKEKKDAVKTSDR